MNGISFFERYLTVWVVLCMIAGVAIGQFLLEVPATLGSWEYANVSIPIAILIWLMIYPMMLKIDFQSVKNVGKKPKGIVVTCVTNWLIKPFSMFAISWLFFFVVFKQFITPELADQYLAGAVLLGAAPCTAMVFVWSYLTKGDAAYTLVQVAINDLIILVAFAPIVAFLLEIGGVAIPWDTLLLSVVLFVVIPLVAGALTRWYIIRKRGLEYLNNVFIKKFSNTTIGGLLLTLVLIFSFQGETILSNPIHILLIAVPLVLQTVIIFFVAYGWAKAWKLPHEIAAPAGLIGASNFFELAVAVAISLFGLQSGAALATVVGVLVEVPVMLTLVKVANKRSEYNDRSLSIAILQHLHAGVLAEEFYTYRMYRRMCISSAISLSDLSVVVSIVFRWSNDVTIDNRFRGSIQRLTSYCAKIIRGNTELICIETDLMLCFGVTHQ